MIDDTDDLDDSHLFSVAADLAKHFEKVLLKIKKLDRTKAVAESPANTGIRQQCQQLMHGDTRFSNAPTCKAASCTCSRQMLKQKPQLQPQSQLQQQQQKMPQQQQPQPVILPPDTNQSNFAATFDQRIRTEPNELRLILKLETCLDDSGYFVVKPSVYEDRGDAIDKAAAAAAAAPVTVSLLKINSVEDNSQPSALATVLPGKSKAKNTQQQQQQQQQQQVLPSGKRLRNYLKNSVQEIGQHLQGTTNSGTIKGRKNRRLGGASDQAPGRSAVAKRRLDFQAHRTGGDDCQVNNHHDSVSEHLSDNSDTNSFDSDADSYRHNLEGAGVPASDKPGAHAATQSGDQAVENTRELIERLQELIKNDPNAALEY